MYCLELKEERSLLFISEYPSGLKLADVIEALAKLVKISWDYFNTYNFSEILFL